MGEGGEREKEWGQEDEGGEAAAQGAGVGATGFRSAALGSASCLLAHGNPPDLIKE